MEKIRFDVVGLYHWDVRDRWKEYAAGAVGKVLTLQPQPENQIDPYAVRVREGSLHVGYVAVPDLDAVYQTLKGAGRRRLRGIVVESNPEPPVLTVECEVEAVDWTYEPFDDSVYAGWHYDGLPLMPKKLEQLNDLTEDLIEALEGVANHDTLSARGVANRGPILDMTTRLLESNLYDVSREMTRARYRIERLLAQHSDPKLQSLTYQLRHQKGMLMNHDSREQVARYLFIELPRELLRKGLQQSRYTYDNRLDELEQQLHAFPYQLYDKFQNDPVDFLREVYYHHVPRRQLFPLLSGIVLMILKGRVTITRWGREGDTEPIRLIADIGKPQLPQGASDREEALKQGVRELLEKKDARGYLIINQKNLWAAIMSVLVFEYHVIPEPDMKAFCRKMDDWGFGEGSGYEKWCDYDSLSKCSDYALFAFSAWHGSGKAHQRQILAATELRVILRPLIGYC